MRLKSALRRGVAAAVIAGIVVSSGIPAYAGTWDIADGDITVKAGDEGTNRVTAGREGLVKDDRHRHHRQIGRAHRHHRHLRGRRGRHLRRPEDRRQRQGRGGWQR
ncbi:MAG: hypothetical protein ACLUSS_07565 [Faecalibacterium sp.]